MKILKRLRRKAQKLLYKEQYSLIVRGKSTGEEAHFRPPSADMTRSEYATALKKPCHLSYPHLFECGGNLYMIPETNENNTIDCYVCASFPNKWEFHSTLIRGIRAVDTDIVQHGGLFFLVTNAELAPGEGLNSKACVYYAERFPTSEWKAHPANPVVSSLASSRNAGWIARKGDKLYRPAQDCAAFYGRAVRLMQIEELTPQSYREREVALIEAPTRWNAKGYKAIGTHTYNESENYIVSDIKTRTRRLP